VLALSLMGLVLGMWLRQSEGRGGRAPGPPHRSFFFKKTYKIWVENKVYQIKQTHSIIKK
ncbi:hypothetical protein, partial [Enterobacter hormaechei]